MCHPASVAIRTGCVLVLAASLALAQRTEWRRVGGSVIEAGVSGPASGPVERVWYNAGALLARTGGGQVFQTTDFENWQAVAEAAAPERAGIVRGGSPRSLRAYTFAADLFRSDDEGRTWSNVSTVDGRSKIGRVLDVAVSPVDDDDITAATEFGVFRSLDGGDSWASLNANLPNLPAGRIKALFPSAPATRVEIGGREYVWLPGEKHGWREAEASVEEVRERSRLSAALGVEITAFAAAGEYIYAGSIDGRLWSSSDGGANWRSFGDGTGRRVLRIIADARDPRTAVAAAEPGERTPIVLRSFNGGQFWDDWTSNLPSGATVSGLAYDRDSGALYAASSAGLFTTRMRAAAPAGGWTRTGEGLPAGAVRDVALDAGANQIFVTVDGMGLYAAIAPHRFSDPRVVDAADLAVRPAAPGGVLTVLGMKVDSARAGTYRAPVLAATAEETQIQIPFEVEGNRIQLTLTGAAGALRVPLAVEAASPAILVDRDGAPLLMESTGVLLDSSQVLRPGSRIQLLATGLGRVRPEWIAGRPAPLDDSPAVVAPVRVLLDREPVNVVRAVLAPGYVGFYLVEVELPAVLNAGPKELMVEVDGRLSNRVLLMVDY